MHNTLTKPLYTAIVCTNMKLLTIIFGIVMLSAFSYNCNAQLKLSISGLVKQESVLFIAVFDNAEDFLTEKRFYTKKIATSGGVAILEINDLPFGTYAISVFQDLNANDKLDRKLFGVPVEPYGFSVSTARMTRAPTFLEASFEYSNAMEIKIPLIKR